MNNRFQWMYNLCALVVMLALLSLFGFVCVLDDRARSHVPPVPAAPSAYSAAVAYGGGLTYALDSEGRAVIYEVRHAN